MSSDPAPDSLVDTLRRGDRRRFLTALFAPPARRPALFALYAVHLELARARETVREPVLGQIRLQWWREAIIAAAAGHAPRHAALIDLAPLLASGRLATADFDMMIDAREIELDAPPPPDLPWLEAWLDSAAAPLIRLALAALDVPGDHWTLASRLGRAQGLAGLMASLPQRLAQGRIDLPLAEMARAGFTEMELRHAPRPPGLARAVAAVAARSEEHLAAARPLLRALPRVAAPVRLLGPATARLLAGLARAGHDPFAPQSLRVDGLLPALLWWKSVTGGV